MTTTVTGIPISGLPAGAALDGSELVPVVQGGVTVQTTTQEIADLGGGGAVLTIYGNAVGSAFPAGVNNNFNVDVSNANRLQLTLAGDAELTGLVAATIVDGHVLVVQNYSAFTLTIPSESVLSLAANRFVSNGDIIIPAGCGHSYMRDINLNRWVEI